MENNKYDSPHIHINKDGKITHIVPMLMFELDKGKEPLFMRNNINKELDKKTNNKYLQLKRLQMKALFLYKKSKEL